MEGSSNFYSVGDRVLLLPNSRFAGQSGGTVGVVTFTISGLPDWGLPYHVKWENGHTNSYGNSDLTLYCQKNREAIRLLKKN